MHAKLLVAMLVALCAVVGFATAVTLEFEDGIHTVATPFPIEVGDIQAPGILAGYVYDGANWVIVGDYSSDYIIQPTSAMFIVAGEEASIIIEPEDQMYSLPFGYDHVDIPLSPGTYFMGIAPRQDSSQSWMTDQLTFGSLINENANSVKLVSPSANDGYCWETTNPAQVLDVYKGYWVIIGDGGATKNQYWV